MPEGKAIVLVGVRGPHAVNYLQFCHSQFGGCLNYRIPPLANDVIALPVSLPKAEMELGSYTLAGRPAGYIGAMAVGYIGMDDPEFNLTERGVYFHVTIDTSEDGNFSATPDEEFIRRAAEKYGDSLTSMTPLNFSWR